MKAWEDSKCENLPLVSKTCLTAKWYIRYAALTVWDSELTISIQFMVKELEIRLVKLLNINREVLELDLSDLNYRLCPFGGLITKLEAWSLISWWKTTIGSFFHSNKSSLLDLKRYVSLVWNKLDQKAVLQQSGGRRLCDIKVWFPINGTSLVFFESVIIFELYIVCITKFSIFSDISKNQALRTFKGGE